MTCTCENTDIQLLLRKIVASSNASVTVMNLSGSRRVLLFLVLINIELIDIVVTTPLDLALCTYVSN